MSDRIERLEIEILEDPDYPLTYSTFAYEMGANMIVYGMSH